MDLIEIIARALLGIIQLIIGLGLAMGAIYIGINLLDRLTKGIDEQEELKKGNKAVAFLMFGVIVAIAIVIAGGVEGLTKALTGELSADWKEWLVAVGAGLGQLIAGLIFAVVAIYLAFRIWDEITTKIDETKELKQGNVAIGIVMCGIMIAVAIVVRAGVSGLASAVGA